MLAGDKNLKDSEQNSITSYGTNFQDMSVTLSYTKTNKLITALYMVTDIMDKEEPIRNKLRSLGIKIVSDIYSFPKNTSNKISEIVSFLNIASAMNFISEMNCAVLKKEFLELKQSIQEDIDIKPTWLEEFFLDSKSIGHTKLANRQQMKTRIGVQKGSTLMKALSDKNLVRSFGRYSLSNSNDGIKSGVLDTISQRTKQDFALLKKTRQENIIYIIRNNGGSATIKDIRTKINIGAQDSLICSEKTIQRELMSMIKNNILNKTGEKRWSRYSLLAS